MKTNSKLFFGTYPTVNIKFIHLFIYLLNFNETDLNIQIVDKLTINTVLSLSFWAAITS